MAVDTSFFSDFKAGDSLYLSGASGEPAALTQALSKALPDLPPISIYNSFLPGINCTKLAAAQADISEYPVFPRRLSVPNANIIYQSRSYFMVDRFLDAQSFDWAFVLLSRPNKDGIYSLAPSAEFLPTVLKRTRYIVGIMNSNLPYIKNAPQLTANALTSIVETEDEPIVYEAGPEEEVSSRIAEHIASIVWDGDTLQFGLGKVPAQLSDQLSEHKNLRIHSGLVSDSLLTLVDAGAIDLNYAHKTCCVMGSQTLYDRLPKLDFLSVHGVNHTHAPETLAGLSAFTAINSALDVDLYGQANLESLSHNTISNVGGAADFARAAKYSVGGKSIIALPSTSRDGKHSRIRASIPRVSLPQHDIDYVVTEHGIADLNGKNEQQRANALIAIAEPKFRHKLESDLEHLTGSRGI